jgi:hypothetical protein
MDHEWLNSRLDEARNLDISLPDRNKLTSIFEIQEDRNLLQNLKNIQQQVIIKN